MNIIHPDNPDMSINYPQEMSLTNHPSSLLKHSSTRVRLQPLWKQKILLIIDHWIFTVWLTLLTVYALFGDDIRLAATPMSYDDGFYSMSCVCLFFFALELVLSSVAKEQYIFGFYFWLDLLSTISLITDIGWVWNPIIGNTSTEGSQTAQTSQVIRAGRASRAGTRAARIIRIVRVIRLIRIVKLYKIAEGTKNELAREAFSGRLQRSNVSYRGFSNPVFAHSASHIPEQMVTESDDPAASFTFDPAKSNPRGSESTADMASGLGFIRERSASLDPKSPLGTVLEEDDDFDDIKVPEESRVGKKLSDLTTKRTIVLVLAMMFCLPLFDSTFYYEDNVSFIYGLHVLERFIGREEGDFQLAYNSYIDQHSNIETPLIYLEIAGYQPAWQRDVNYLDLRPDEQIAVSYSGDVYNLYAVLDQHTLSRVQSALNISKTMFICIVLTVSTLFFSKDANTLVIGPIENMIENIKRISKNPLEAAQHANKEAVVKEFLTKKKAVKEGQMETTLLENTIEKIGALLAIGFGEAGSEIIVANMKKGSGDVDPMIPGKKMECVFGFCDIRNFADATEVLQEGVMAFVNEIAYIVHTTVYHFSGSTNKNTGDAFLLVWKLPSSINSETMDLSLLAERHFARQLADMAVMSFMKIWANIHKNPNILKYRQNQSLRKRMPNFSVKMGFGLHAGWAIEGAIGSEYKIDASYLSPHVNLASRLEAATKQYGVPILVSGKVYQLVTSITRKLLRQIDRVTVKGSQQPIDLYTPDMNVQKLQPEKVLLPTEVEDKKTTRLKMMELRDQLKNSILKDKRMISYLYQEDQDFLLMLDDELSGFRMKFEEGFQSYLAGKWMAAKKSFLAAEKELGKEDGPCRTLIAVINDNQEEAPTGWPGYRELTEK